MDTTNNTDPEKLNFWKIALWGFIVFVFTTMLLLLLVNNLHLGEFVVTMFLTIVAALFIGSIFMTRNETHRNLGWICFVGALLNIILAIVVLCAMASIHC